MATQGVLSSLELRVQFCLLVCCTYPSSSTVNKEKNLIDQRASLRVDTRETQQINWRRRHWDFPYRSTSYRRSYPIRSFFASIVSTMSETTELIKLLADQIQIQRQQMEQQAKQMEQHSQQHRAEMEQAQHHREEMHNLLKILDVQNMTLVKMIPVLIIPRPGPSKRSARNRRRVLSRTISSLIPKTSRSATDVERSTKYRTAPIKKRSVISVTKRDICKLFARRSSVKSRDVLPTTQ